MLVTATFEIPDEEFGNWLIDQKIADGDLEIDDLTGQRFLDGCFAVLYTDSSSYHADWLNL